MAFICWNIIHFMKKILLLVPFIILTTIEIKAQTFSNEFLSIGVGARAQALGKSVIATTDDVTASFWNPSGLVRNVHDDWQFAGMHAELFAGVGKFDYLAATKKIDDNRKAVSLSLIRFGIDDIPNTLNLFEADGSINFDNVVPFSAADYAFLGGYSQYLFKDSDRWTVGGNLKVVYRNIGPFANAFGFGVDGGIQYWGEKWKLGLAVSDITGTFNAWTFNFTEEEKEVLQLTDNELPENSIEVTRPKATLGIGTYKQLQKGFGLAVEGSIIATFDGKRNTLIKTDQFSVSPGLGAEIDYKQFAFLRFGLSNLQQDTDINTTPFWTVDPSLGLGVKIKNFQLDYAFTDIGDQRNGTFSHVFSLLFNLQSKAVKEGF